MLASDFLEKRENCAEKFYGKKYFSQETISDKHCILSLLSKKASRKLSNATKDTNLVLPNLLDYDLNDIEKINEKDMSISDISYLDLDNETEEDDLKKMDDSFNSLDDEDEGQEIKVKSKIKAKRYSFTEKDDFEFNKKLDNDFLEIEKILENRRKYSMPVDDVDNQF